MKNGTKSFVEEDYKIEERKNPSGKEKIKLYKNIFAEEPWGEGFICETCNAIFSGKFLGKCNCGNSDIKPFYKNTELKETFESLSKKDGYQEKVARVLDKNIGFIWGWNTNLKALNYDKLGLGEIQFRELEKNIMTKYSNFDLNNFYYFAELGVKNQYRKEKIASKLYEDNLKKLKQNGAKYILVRTTRKTDVPYKWFKNMGYEDVFLYLDEQDRVILVFKID